MERLLHWGKIVKMECKYQSHSLHFVFYTLSSGSCLCFAQSGRIDPVLPSFPYQNSETGRQSDRLSNTAVLNQTDDVARPDAKYNALCLALCSA